MGGDESGRVKDKDMTLLIILHNNSLLSFELV